MFIGHYGLAYAVKSRFAHIPVWALFTAVQLMDLAAFLLVFAGIEKAAYRADPNPFFRNELVLPWSHSLSGAVLLSAAAFGVCAAARRRSWAAVIFLCVLSHWIIDFIVHTPDLSIFFGSVPVGLGLWNYPYVSYAAEILMLVGGWMLVRYRDIYSILTLVLMTGSLTGMMFGSEPAGIRDHQSLRTGMVLATNAAFIALAYLGEKKRLNAVSRRTARAHAA
ncbi:MAG: hypothetical protein EPN93_14160 [Spirochaetes bacterium]|nr:MAG: hypothetical protein EPN93_14160 [Spirochaetota bacterium]